METDEVQDMTQMSGEVTTESILISNLVLYRVWEKKLQNIMPCKNKKRQIIVNKVYVRKRIVHGFASVVYNLHYRYEKIALYT